MTTLILAALLSSASASTLEGRPTVALIAGEQYLGEAFPIDGDFWIPAATLDASLGGALSQASGVLQTEAAITFGIDMHLGIFTPISDNLVPFSKLGVSEQDYVEAVDMFHDAGYDLHGGALIPASDLAKALGAEVKDGTSGGTWDGEVVLQAAESAK